MGIKVDRPDLVEAHDHKVGERLTEDLRASGVWPLRRATEQALQRHYEDSQGDQLDLWDRPPALGPTVHLHRAAAEQARDIGVSEPDCAGGVEDRRSAEHESRDGLA